MKRKIAFLAYGFILIVIWGMCFLSSGVANSFTAAIGLSFTFLSLYFLQKEYDFKLNTWDKIALLSFPVFHVLSSYFVLIDNGTFSTKKYNLYQLLFYFHLINPLNIAFIGLLLGLTKLKDLANPRNIFICTYIVLFYSYFFHAHWMGIWLGTQVKSFDTEKVQDAENQDNRALDAADSVNLSDFLFINSRLDTTSLTSVDSGKYLLLETWSETCLPCIRAMNELPDFYQTIADRVDVYYVYESKKERVRNKFEQIFKFKNIQDKSKILIDINQDLYYSIDMQGVPYFLLFDPEGKLVYRMRGYRGKKVLSEKILEHIR